MLDVARTSIPCVRPFPTMRGKKSFWPVENLRLPAKILLAAASFMRQKTVS